jgi:hypothetical protein
MTGAKLTNVWFMSLLSDWLRSMQTHLDTLIAHNMVNETWVEPKPCARLRALGFAVDIGAECVDDNYHMAFQLICSVGDQVTFCRLIMSVTI